MEKGTSHEVILLPQTRRAELDGKTLEEFLFVSLLLRCFRSQQNQGLDFRDVYLSFFGILSVFGRMDTRGDHDG